MIDIIKLFEKILTFISLFNKELDMTVSPWTSGNCEVTNSSKYSVFIIIQNGEPIIAIRNDNDIIGFSVSIATGNSEYVKAFKATTNSDTWTLSYSNQLTHTASSSHDAGTSQSVTKIIGLIPLA